MSVSRSEERLSEVGYRLARGWLADRMEVCWFQAGDFDAGDGYVPSEAALLEVKSFRDQAGNPKRDTVPCVALRHTARPRCGHTQFQELLWRGCGWPHRALYLVRVDVDAEEETLRSVQTWRITPDTRLDYNWDNYRDGRERRLIWFRVEPPIVEALSLIPEDVAYQGTRGKTIGG